MTLNELRYVVAVAQELSFRRAAGKVFVSQPALSLAVAKLEDELGVKLFERTRTDVQVTAVGRLVVAQAERALEECARVKTVAAGGRDQLTGVLRLGTIYTVGPYLLPRLVVALHAIAPAMPLEIEESITASLTDRLRNGALDIAIIALPFEEVGVETIPLYDEAFSVVVPRAHPWAGRATIAPAELNGEKVYLLHSGHCFANQVAEVCPGLSGSAAVHEGNSLETVRNMVASGLGITVLPNSAVSGPALQDLLAVVPFDAPVPSRRIALAYRSSFVRPQAVAALVRAVHAASLPGVELVPAPAALAVEGADHRDAG